MGREAEEEEEGSAYGSRSGPDILKRAVPAAARLRGVGSASEDLVRSERRKMCRAGRYNGLTAEVAKVKKL